MEPAPPAFDTTNVVVSANGALSVLGTTICVGCGVNQHEGICCEVCDEPLCINCVHIGETQLDFCKMCWDADDDCELYVEPAVNYNADGQLATALTAAHGAGGDQTFAGLTEEQKVTLYNTVLSMSD